MAKRRFQDPQPKREGKFWYLLYWQDSFNDGIRTRKRQRIKIAPATMPEREAKKIAAEILRPMNQGLISAGSAVTFSEYVENEYLPSVIAATFEQHTRLLPGGHRKISDANLRNSLLA